MTPARADAGGRQVVAGEELRRLGEAVADVPFPIDSATGRVGAIMGGLDRRGWNAGTADGLWSAVRSEWVCLKGSLVPTAKDLFRRALLADILNGRSGTPWGPGSDPFTPFGPLGPLGPLGGPLFAPDDLGAYPWLTPEERELLRRQGAAALNDIPFRALSDDPPTVGGGGGGGGGGSWGDDGGGAGDALYAGAGIALAGSGALLADDVTVVGIADDPAIPFVLGAAGVLALGGLILNTVSSDDEPEAPAEEQPSPAAVPDPFKSGRTPKASEIEEWAESQGWTKQQTPNGPPKYVDENGVPRVTIKEGSPRAPGSDQPHVELRDSTGQRVDPDGNPVTRRSPDNHTPIDYDW